MWDSCAHSGGCFPKKFPKIHPQCTMDGKEGNSDIHVRAENLFGPNGKGLQSLRKDQARSKGYVEVQKIYQTSVRSGETL